ncbi:hypothetical protein HYX05_05165 [Candidatus Woesearchaeota archaeon]|nr:hypothetical protein [Candidatus Woesearchaeota archaeon]
MKSAIYMEGHRFEETEFKSEDDFEKIIKQNSKTIFGDNTIYLDLKNRIETKTLGGSIPDGFLFDFKDKENPEFYIVEVELESHPFDGHIFPQIKKFFAFFKNPKSRDDLIGRIHHFITNNTIETDFKKYLGNKELYKTLKDTIENSQNILLIINENKQEFEETEDTITEWARFVKVEILKQYTANNKTIFTLNPDFENIGLFESTSKEEHEDVKYTENFHLEGSEEEIVSIYTEIKNFIISLDSNIKINPQKYYISLREKKNFAYLDIKRKKIKIAIMVPYEMGNSIIKYHKLRKFTDGIQRFYGNPSFEITIENKQNFDEVKTILQEAYKKQK